MRHPVKLKDWPPADRVMWKGLIATGDIFDEVGLGAHWKPVTRNNLMGDYGYWLAYLQEAEVDLTSTSPADRVTPTNVARYIRSFTAMAHSTGAARIRGLSVIMPRAQPTMDWLWLYKMRRPLDALERQHRGLKKRNRVVSSHTLYGAGVGLMECARTSTAWTPRRRAVAFRDGLAIALLALRPLRLKNFAGLRLGYHLTPVSFGYRIDIPAAESKTGVPIETVVPEELLTWLCEYLTVHRPVLLGGARHDRLWIMYDGRPYSLTHFGERIAKVTERLLGVRVNPHLFRDCAATTIATVDPKHVRMIASLLGHSTPTTAERYYNQAKGIEAADAHQRNLLQLRGRRIR